MARIEFQRNSVEYWILNLGFSNVLCKLWVIVFPSSLTLDRPTLFINSEVDIHIRLSSSFGENLRLKVSISKKVRHCDINDFFKCVFGLHCSKPEETFDYFIYDLMLVNTIVRTLNKYVKWLSPEIVIMLMKMYYFLSVYQLNLQLPQIVSRTVAKVSLSN